MPKDPYSATWVSHSSINDYLRCPMVYYYRYVYKNPQTGHKINFISPALATGQAVHEVLESLSKLKTDERFLKPLHQRLAQTWIRISGKKGGFRNQEIEHRYRKRAEAMLERVYKNPGPLAKLSVKIKAEKDLPRFWMSDEDNIILCGKIDWLEFLQDSDSVHIIDFKTGRSRESEESLQLPIYFLLASNCQDRPVTQASYWYLETESTPSAQKLPDEYKARNKILEIALRIKLARQWQKFDCPSGGCRLCKPFEKILRGECELVGRDLFGSDIYVDLKEKEHTDVMQSELL